MLGPSQQKDTKKEPNFWTEKKVVEREEDKGGGKEGGREGGG